MYLCRYTPMDFNWRTILASATLFMLCQNWVGASNPPGSPEPVQKPTATFRHTGSGWTFPDQAGEFRRGQGEQEKPGVSAFRVNYDAPALTCMLLLTAKDPQYSFDVMLDHFTKAPGSTWGERQVGANEQVTVRSAGAIHQGVYRSVVTILSPESPPNVRLGFPSGRVVTGKFVFDLGKWYLTVTALPDDERTPQWKARTQALLETLSWPAQTRAVDKVGP